MADSTDGREYGNVCPIKKTSPTLPELRLTIHNTRVYTPKNDSIQEGMLSFVENGSTAFIR